MDFKQRKVVKTVDEFVEKKVPLGLIRQLEINPNIRVLTTKRDMERLDRLIDRKNSHLVAFIVKGNKADTNTEMTKLKTRVDDMGLTSDWAMDFDVAKVERSFRETPVAFLLIGYKG